MPDDDIAGDLIEAAGADALELNVYLIPTDPYATGEDVVLKGPVSSASEPSITILGVTFSTQVGTTEFELCDQPTDSSTFYGGDHHGYTDYPSLADS